MGGWGEAHVCGGGGGKGEGGMPGVCSTQHDTACLAWRPWGGTLACHTSKHNPQPMQQPMQQPMCGPHARPPMHPPMRPLMRPHMCREREALRRQLGLVRDGSLWEADPVLGRCALRPGSLACGGRGGGSVCEGVHQGARAAAHGYKLHGAGRGRGGGERGGVDCDAGIGGEGIEGAG